MMMAHQTKIHPDPTGKRVFFMDNFYTRHVLARALKNITQDEARIVGTIKFTNVDATNRPHLTKAIALMKNEPHDSWKLADVTIKLRIWKNYAANMQLLNEDCRPRIRNPSSHRQKWLQNVLVILFGLIASW
jgi:hypothetical protein